MRLAWIQCATPCPWLAPATKDDHVERQQQQQQQQQSWSMSRSRAGNERVSIQLGSRVLLEFESIAQGRGRLPAEPMLNCNSHRAEGLQEAFFSTSDKIQAAASNASAVQSDFINHLLPPLFNALDAAPPYSYSAHGHAHQFQPHHKLGQASGAAAEVQGFGSSRIHQDHAIYGTFNVNHANAIDLLAATSGMEPAHLDFPHMDNWTALPPALHSYRNLLVDSHSLDYGHTGGLEQVTCASTPLYDSTVAIDTPRESDSSNSTAHSFQSALLSSGASMSLNQQQQHNSPPSPASQLLVQKAITYDAAGLGLNGHHHPSLGYTNDQVGPHPSFISLDNQIHLGTPLDPLPLPLPMNGYSSSLAGGAGIRLPADNLTHLPHILPSKAAAKCSTMLPHFSPPHNFLFGRSLTAPPTLAVSSPFKLPHLTFKTNNTLDAGLNHFHTVSKHTTVCNSSSSNLSKDATSCFHGARSVVLDDVESTGPRPGTFDHLKKNAVPASHQSTQTSTSSDSITKRPRLEQSATQPTLPFKVRKEKLGERITSLQQLVSPFGKTDTASVLLEAINYIQFLQEQVQVLSTPYMKKNMCRPHENKQPWTTADKENAGGDRDRERDRDRDREPELNDLRSKGLCLMPIRTIHVANDNGADYWTPTIGGGSSTSR